MKRLAAPIKTRSVPSRIGRGHPKYSFGVLAKSDSRIQYLRVRSTAMFSRSAGYSIQALTYLAGQPSGKLTGTREIATASRIPMPYLWKILRNLSQKRLLRSDHNPCALHTSWKNLRPEIQESMEGTTLADLAREWPKSVQKRNPSWARNRSTRP